jgi:hypothetical protein
LLNEVLQSGKYSCSNGVFVVIFRTVLYPCEKLQRARSESVCVPLILEGYVQSKAHAVTQLVKALRYKPEGRTFDSRWCHWNFSLIFPPGRIMTLKSTQSLTEKSTRIFPGDKGGRCVGLTTLPPSCADSWNLGASTFWNPQGLSGIALPLLYGDGLCYISVLYVGKSGNMYLLHAVPQIHVFLS